MFLWAIKYFRDMFILVHIKSDFFGILKFYELLWTLFLFELYRTFMNFKYFFELHNYGLKGSKPSKMSNLRILIRQNTSLDTCESNLACDM